MDLEAIRIRKKIRVNNNNQLESRNRKPHRYIIRDKVLVNDKKTNSYKDPYIGPYPITQI